MGLISVFARWRPLEQSDAELGEIDRTTSRDSSNLLSVTIKRRSPDSNRPWTSSPAFRSIFHPEHHNHQVYEVVVAQNILKVLRGENCSLFAYGHSGSGKTHTIMGYDFQNTEELGLCLAAAKQLFDALHSLNEQNTEQKLGLGFSLFELRKKSAFDLLNHRTQCHVRQGPDGKVHIRGETEMLEGGKVRVRPIVQIPCWEFEPLQRELVKAIGQRAQGSSSVHDQSSRTHAVLELEIVSQPLVDARYALFDRQSELVPVGKRATDIKIEESMKSIIRTPDGGYVPNPDYKEDQERINAVEAEQAQYEARVKEAENKIEGILASSHAPYLGAKMVFVDLAGAEYFEGNGSGPTAMKQTPQGRQEGRQINSDLLALKEVMRAWSRNETRIPFRSSTLTMVLQDHFISTGKGNSTIIVTLSPAGDQYAATLNSLKYASLVGAAST
ncbi:hypothetical protein FSARC_11490 [Fusarium sarcochroum]|uniref:Kinesin motor domain-containing protein n=1 Tax=Fusarium sarcochroum TaxID=1208366 RepID=A0A8H4TF21_9HYPO|nr:hypothetical protein FSARC_11490 [Fusarium sarcochroum]